MNCPICLHPETFIVRTDPGDNSNKRRRECCQCHHRFNTYETTENKVQELDKLRSVLAPVAEMVK